MDFQEFVFFFNFESALNENDFYRISLNIELFQIGGTIASKKKKTLHKDLNTKKIY